MSNDEEVRITVKKKRGRPPKKKKIDIVEKKKEEKKEIRKEVKKEKISRITESSSKPKSKKNKKGMFHHFINMIITASLVGGGIYLWQKTTGEEILNKLKSETRNARLEFDNRIKIVKEKLKGVEYENSELKTVNEKLKNKAGLLDEAVRNFKDTNLGFSFIYPAIFGDADYKTSDSETGKIFRGKFLENVNLVFGGSSELLISSTSPVNTILNAKGFNVEDGVYYFNNDNETEKASFKPLEVINLTDKIQIVIIDHTSLIKTAKKEDIKKDENVESEISEEYKQEDVLSENNDIDIFQDFESKKTVAAIVNLNSEQFNGLVFLNKNIDELALNNFKAILETLIIK